LLLIRRGKNTIYKNHLDLFGRYVTYTAKGNWKRAALPF